ncbi:hypothetical protein [Oceanobacillus halophilus]|uniref:Uncharacterized protein n=1 Tax=Oceanobacillus halophilus TaxID=930130 RepID=A0A495A424_9BACI|nr:hypothetical protein [Oceanobacillus halophilus]RKQ34267.1 hypothetical protein D8M06_07755 [Oceanobacillus halophilus]
MDIQLIKDFLPILGVIVGFLLATVKDLVQNRLQNKPRVKIDMKKGNFNYFIDGTDTDGFSFRRTCKPHIAGYFDLNLQIDVYNYGKGDTAIKEILIETKVNKNDKAFLQPEMEIKGRENNDYSFNLPSKTIETINLKLRVEKEEDSEALFNEEVTLLPEDNKRLLFTILVKNINNKTYKLKVEPLSILTAVE